ncbi:MAG: hypothetical protein WCF18_09590 [Chthoniobacteraceae bacterium]
MSNLLIHLQALNDRLEFALARRHQSPLVSYVAQENYDTRPGLQSEHIGAMAGAAGGLAAGAALPSIARRQVGIYQANRNAQAGRIRTARMQDRVAAAKGISNERIAGAGIRTTGKLGAMGKLRNANFRLNKRLAGGGSRGIAAGVLGIGGALGGYAGGKLLNPATY